jgi:hypothetical protein
MRLWVSGTIKRQKGHFVRVESTKALSFVMSDSQKHTILRLPLFHTLNCKPKTIPTWFGAFFCALISYEGVSIQ